MQHLSSQLLQCYVDVLLMKTLLWTEQMYLDHLTPSSVGDQMQFNISLVASVSCSDRIVSWKVAQWFKRGFPQHQKSCRLGCYPHSLKQTAPALICLWGTHIYTSRLVCETKESEPNGESHFKTSSCLDSYITSLFNSPAVGTGISSILSLYLFILVLPLTVSDWDCLSEFK